MSDYSMLAPVFVLAEVRNWNLDMMRKAVRDGRERDAWRHSGNAEQLRLILARQSK